MPNDIEIQARLARLEHQVHQLAAAVEVAKHNIALTEELPPGWEIEDVPGRSGGHVLKYMREGKLTTYCGRDSAVIFAWLEHLGHARRNGGGDFHYESRTLSTGKVWWGMNRLTKISSPDFKRPEDCIRACELHHV